MIPTPWTLTIRPWLRDDTTPRGARVVVYGDLVPWPVHAIAPGAPEEPDEVRRELQESTVTVYAPAAGPRPGPRDQVDIDGTAYEVEGTPADWSRGPWPYPEAGIVVLLRKVTG